MIRIRHFSSLAAIALLTVMIGAPVAHAETQAAQPATLPLAPALSPGSSPKAVRRTASPVPESPAKGSSVITRPPSQLLFDKTVVGQNIQGSSPRRPLLPSPTRGKSIIPQGSQQAGPVSARGSSTMPRPTSVAQQIRDENSRQTKLRPMPLVRE
ncbi:MAG: hypothetical protein ABI831_07835 [Betaproteobacteria bacterium]